MSNQIVTVNVSQTIAPTPSTLQKTGALISQGGTSTAPGTRSLLTQLADLTPILKGALALTSLAWNTNVVTATATAPHGFDIGDELELTIAGASPAEYNGTYLCTVTTTTAFTYALMSNPGSETVPGTYTPEDVAELLSMATTFFAQGASQAVYVLELGPDDAEGGVADLTAYITANPSFFYSYLVPRNWDAVADFLAMLNNFTAPTAKTYFFITTTVENYEEYSDLLKCAVTMIESPDKPAGEFSLASMFWVTLHYAPSTTNKVTPTAFSYLFGVTPYPTDGNSALRTLLKAAGVNIVGTGAEGGISNTILLWGMTMDLRDFTYWYSVDWVQINGALDVANTVINGSNNPINPLYYNQDGINRLQDKLAGTMARAITFGLALGTVTQTAYDGPGLTQAIAEGQFAAQAVVNAVPFIPYSRDNPSDYKIGNYAGLGVIYVPARGFISIVFNINVTDFVTQ
jgi:hypothetical protein